MGRWAIPPEIHSGGRFLLRRRDFTPAYLETYEAGRLPEKVDEALASLGPSCRACPRLCKGVDRRAPLVRSFNLVCSQFESQLGSWKFGSELFHSG